MLLAVSLSARIADDDDKMNIDRPAVSGVDLTKVMLPTCLHDIYGVTVFALPFYAYINYDVLRFYTQQEGLYTELGGGRDPFSGQIVCHLVFV